MTTVEPTMFCFPLERRQSHKQLFGIEKARCDV